MDYVSNDETARLFDAQDKSKLKNAIVELIESPEDVQRMAEAGFSKACLENNPHNLLRYFIEFKNRFS